MKPTTTATTMVFRAKTTVFILSAILGIGTLNKGYSQDNESPYIAYNIPFQNLLKFNRFLINPTFSSVREDKTYINFFHRTQGSSFENNNQNYFLSYSARLDGQTGLGLSLYNQQSGIISNIGIMANYAYGVRLSEKSDLSFGFNIPYYKSSFDESRAVAQSEDPVFDTLNNTSIISFQPGFNLSLGRFDFGLFAQNLFDYNIKTASPLTSFEEKIFSGHLQFAHEFNNATGIFEDGRLMPLARAQIQGNRNAVFGGGLIIDLPKLGWIQGGYDQLYGASAGTGFNLNKQLSFGYSFEKNLSNSLNNLGVTHEISLAYSFVPNLTKNVFITENGQQYEKKDRLVDNTSNSKNTLVEGTSIEAKLQAIKTQQATHLALIDELIFKLDSIEEHQQRDLERRFETTIRLMKLARTIDSRVDKSKAAELFLTTETQLADNDTKQPIIEEKNTSSQYKKGVFVGGAFKPIEKFITLEGVGKGHYLIANVYSNEKYMNLFLDKLRKEGHQPKHFKNPKNGLNYVYLQYFEKDEDSRSAFEAYKKGTYSKDLWIMHVENTKYLKFADTKFEEE